MEAFTKQEQQDPVLELIRLLWLSAKRDGELGRDGARTKEVAAKLVQQVQLLGDQSQKDQV